MVRVRLSLLLRAFLHRPEVNSLISFMFLVTQMGDERPDIVIIFACHVVFDLPKFLDNFVSHFHILFIPTESIDGNEMKSTMSFEKKSIILCN
jgi:hypothetical protein